MHSFRSAVAFALCVPALACRGEPRSASAEPPTTGAPIASAPVPELLSGGPVVVEHAGAMRDMFDRNDIAAHAELAPLLARPHLYALGPLENLQGEIMVWDGIPCVSRLVDGRCVVTTEPAASAVFLVWVWVDSWQELDLPADARALAAFESWLPTAAMAAGIDPETPFPFLLIGSAERASVHVVALHDDGAPLTREKHNAAKSLFNLASEPVEVAGFRSTHDAGTWTHHTTTLHLHLRNRAGEIMGHVEELTMAPGAKLLLPAEKVEPADR